MIPPLRGYPKQLQDWVRSIIVEMTNQFRLRCTTDFELQKDSTGTVIKLASSSRVKGYTGVVCVPYTFECGTGDQKGQLLVTYRKWDIVNGVIKTIDGEATGSDTICDEEEDTPEESSGTELSPGETPVPLPPAFGAEDGE